MYIISCFMYFYRFCAFIDCFYTLIDYFYYLLFYMHLFTILLVVFSQIVSQLGDQSDLHFGLVNLLADARRWLSDTSQPLLVPVSSNHITRSQFLRYEIDVNLYDGNSTSNSISVNYTLIPHLSIIH